MQRIVVGVDGSDPSLHALGFAADLLAHTEDAELIVVFVRYAYLFLPPHVAEDIYVDFLDEAEREVRDRVQTILMDRELRWKVIVREGEPAEVLCEVAAETGASVVVAGRRGWSPVRELLLGSVSNRLAHRSSCPVVLV